MKSDEELLADAVRCARARRGGAGAPRWGSVMDTFACGSTVAKDLCIRFGFDPYKTAKEQPWPE
jgi:hypothetical protein